jgi:predicted CXXCH cytochrome family protein
MKRFSFIAAIVLLSAACSYGVDTCIECHSQLSEKRVTAPVAGMREDVHTRQGLSCADCHGGDRTAGMKEADPSLAMNPAKGYIGVPKPSQIPRFCARCHSSLEYMRKYNPAMPTDQYEQYLTSVHGQRNQKGDVKVATCVSCHGVHGIKPANDTRSPVYHGNVPQTCGKCHSDPDYMRGYGLPTDQLAKYKKSVHGELLLVKGDNSAPACNNCHGNHGAFPPGVNSISHACGQCHTKNSENFDLSPHREAFAKLGLPQCAACHNNHEILRPTDEFLGLGKGAICAGCHDEKSPGGQAAVIMRQMIEAYKQKFGIADAAVTRAEKAGREASDARFDITEANNLLIEARTMVHAFNPGKLKEVTDKGSTACDNAIKLARTAMVDLAYKRDMLGIFALIVLITAIALYLKIRQIEARQKAKG